MRASRQEQIGSAGVAYVIGDFRQINWGPSENHHHDLGIDLYLQVRDDRRFDRAAFVMAQVKSGASCFAEEAKGESGDITGWWYAEADAKHFEDWVQHGLPHLLILHDPATRVSYWAHVTKEAVTSTGDGFKIFVPVTQRVDGANREALLRVAASAKNSPALQRVADRDDLALEDDLLPLIRCVRPLAVMARAERVRTATLNHRSARLSAAMLGALLTGGDRDAESELMRRADGGDRNAVAALGSATALSPAAAVALIERDAAGCRQLIAEARKGSHRFGGWDSLHALTVVNLMFPTLANWEPVVEAVLDPLVAQKDKIDAVHILAVRADDLPDKVASALRGGMSSGVIAVRGQTAFSQNTEGLVAAAFALGLALGVVDTASAVRRILSWLRGSAVQRRAAGGLLGVLGRRAQDPVIQGALVILASDPQYHVRAKAAAALVRGATSPVPNVVEEAVVAAAREAGCAVPLSVGQALQAAPEVWPGPDTVRAELAVHISARVRAAADGCGARAEPKG